MSNEQGFSGYARLLSKRTLGAVSFWQVREDGKEIQLLLERERLNDYEELIRIPTGSCIRYKGKSGTTRSGTRAVFVEAIRLENLCKIALPKRNPRSGRLQALAHEADLLMNTSIARMAGRMSTLTSTLSAEFQSAGFLEFNTGVLSETVEAGRAEIFSTYCNATSKSYQLALTSEIKLKHLLLAGFGAVFEVFQSFRNEGVDRIHSPEFTLLEGYKTGVDYRFMMEVVERAIRASLETALARWPAEGENGTVQPFDRIRFRDLFQEVTELPFEQCDLPYLIERFPGLFTPGMSKFTWVYKLLRKVLIRGLTRPTFVTEMPSGTSPLVKISQDDPAVSERAALILGGVGVADVYTDENDAGKIRAALLLQAQSTGRAPNRTLLQLAEYGLPPSAGVGIGVNRLGLSLRGDLPFDIRETMLFPLH